jgi:plasmid stabilization system protein ParE
MEQSRVKKYVFHPDAEKELIDAVNYYNTCQENLGYDFSVEVYTTIHGIMAQPQAWQLLKKTIRRALINRFPYGVIYHADKQQIIVLAIMHLHRKPNYWSKRK